MNINKKDIENCVNERPVEELWEELAKLSQHIVEDNLLTKQRKEPYPLSIRRVQLNSIKALVDAIESKNEFLTNIIKG